MNRANDPDLLEPEIVEEETIGPFLIVQYDDGFDTIEVLEKVKGGSIRRGEFSSWHAAEEFIADDLAGTMWLEPCTDEAIRLGCKCERIPHEYEMARRVSDCPRHGDCAEPDYLRNIRKQRRAA